MARRQLIAKTKKKIRVTKSETYLINHKYLGDEPIFKNEYSDSEYARCLNWYNSMCTVNEAREYIDTYLNNVARVEDARKFRQVNDTWIPLTAAWIARMISRGIKVSDRSKCFMENKFQETLSLRVTEPKKEDTTVKVVSIQDRMRDKASDIIADIEELIDKGEEFSLYDWMKTNEIPASYAPRIADYYSPILSELLEALEGEDDQLREAYKKFTKKQLEERVFFFNSIIEDAERYADTTKKTRKPRKSRTVSVEKKLKKLKYQKEDNTFKIASVNPEKIIGCQELWTFNTRYKLLTVLRAIDRGGLQVKGTSIINYDENNSFTKRTGRKPEVYIDKVLNGGKIILRKLMDEMKNDANLGYRINENTILLKVVV